MPSTPAYILGGGLVTALGRGLATHARALASGVAHPALAPVQFAGRELPFHFAADPREEGASFTRMMAQAVEDALDAAALPPEAVTRMGLFVGSTSLDLPLHEAAYTAAYARGDVPAVKEPGYGNLARFIAERYGIEGPQYTLNTACSSSANAVLYARAMLAEGRIDHALVVGAEGYNRLSLLGFAALALLTREGYRPFDRARDGLVLGEGVGALVLGRARHPGVCAVIGAAAACDPSSPTGSRPEHIAEVIRETLDDAGLAPGALAAVKAHGTGTPSNDLSEGQALRAVFGEPPPLTSIKPYFGHTLGACGAIELLCMLACRNEGFLPATPGFTDVDEAVGLRPLAAKAPLRPGPILHNFFGFGGNNTCVVLAPPDGAAGGTA